MLYKEKVEREFQDISGIKTQTKDATCCQMVVQLFLDHPEKIWWWAWEINGRKNSLGDYISHRGCARASDLAIHYPEIVEHRRISRFKVYRLRRENMEEIYKYMTVCTTS